MSALVPLQIVILILTVASIVLSTLYHLTVGAIRLFPVDTMEDSSPSRGPPPDPQPPLFTPFGALSLVALLLTLALHCAQPDYLASRGREDEIADEKAVAAANVEQQQQLRTLEPYTAPSSTPSTLSPSSLLAESFPHPLQQQQQQQRQQQQTSQPPPPSKSSRAYRFCFLAQSTFIAYPRPRLPKHVADATPRADRRRFTSTWYVARALPWLVLLVLWLAVTVGWFVFLYAPRERAYIEIVPGSGWFGWFQDFNRTRPAVDRWVGPAQCRTFELSCQLLLPQAVIGGLLVLLLVAEMVVLYVGQKTLAEELTTCQNEKQQQQQQQHMHVHVHNGAPHSRSSPLEIRHPYRGRRTVAVKPLPPLPDASSPPPPAPPHGAASPAAADQPLDRRTSTHNCTNGLLKERNQSAALE